MKEKTQNEARVCPRIPIDLSVSYKSQGLFMLTEGANISTKGIFIKTKTFELVGTIVDIEFIIGPEREIAMCQGEVVWARACPRVLPDGRVCPPGVGIRFTKISTKVKKLIENTIKSTMAITL